ncbi:hypothetical protein FPFC_010570 [Fructobacillus pseudoficulneus]|uniref:Integral membrane protein n=1 Tax=Fructobacillus pseudoficulneus TaxID=220714 RepID=A0A3F3H577_9LACO|nr:DUF308 domain-containing protein [Fructobacillus pseudoficulneus]GAP02179.1 hypothetical protein FPFC_010570 [Fructobacillus pseudoficulneus]SEH35998.1 Uncharacterized membrane protein HdeD, DUF308 family [Fructobacillus pseudoficulneus]
MNTELMHKARHLIGIEALVFIVIGALITFLPGMTANIAASIIATMMIMIGLFKIVHAIENDLASSWNKAGSMLLGFLYFFAGLIIFLNLSMAWLPFFILVGTSVGLAWLIEGILQLSFASKFGEHQAWFTIAAILNIIAGIILLMSPLFAGTFLWLFAGITLVLLGLYHLFLYFRLQTK